METVLVFGNPNVLISKQYLNGLGVVVSSFGEIGSSGWRREAFVWGLFLIIITNLTIIKATIPTNKMGTLLRAVEREKLFWDSIFGFWASVVVFSAYLFVLGRCFSAIIFRFRS